MKEMINLIMAHAAQENAHTQADRHFQMNVIAIMLLLTMLLEWAC